MVYWETSLVICSIVTHAWALMTIRQQTGDTSQYKAQVMQTLVQRLECLDHPE